MTTKLTDTEMMWLRTDIEDHINGLRNLQEKYRGQTGQNYTPPIRLKEDDDQDTHDAWEDDGEWIHDPDMGAR